MQKLIDSYAEQKKSTTEVLASLISEHLVPILKSWWWLSTDKEEVKKLLEKCAWPDNVDPLRKVRVNDEIFKKMGQPGREVDQDLRGINNSFTSGCRPLVLAWNDLIRAENVIKDANEADSATGHALLGLQDSTPLDLTALRELLDLSLQVFGVTSHQMVTTRRANIKKFINADFHELCDKRHVMDYRMYGDDLKQQIEDLNKFHKLSNQLVVKPPTSKKKSPASQNFWQNKSHFLQGRGRSSTQPHPDHHYGRSSGSTSCPAWGPTRSCGQSSRSGTRNSRGHGQGHHS